MTLEKDKLRTELDAIKMALERLEIINGLEDIKETLERVEDAAKHLPASSEGAINLAWYAVCHALDLLSVIDGDKDIDQVHRAAAGGLRIQ